jgi:MFS family permease
MDPRLKTNIQKIYALKFFAMFLVLMPIIVPFFQSKGIGMSGVYLLQSIFAITVFVMEIPSGYISDLLGRKKSLVCASALKAIGFSLFPFADSLEVLIVAEVLLGIGASLSSGTDIALIYDTLAITDPKKAHIKILGKTLSFLALGEAVAGLISSVLMILLFDMQYLAAISAVISFIPFFISLTLTEPPRKIMKATHKENFTYIYNNLFKQSKVLRLILLHSILTSSGTLFAVWLFQKYWLDISIPLVIFGFLWAIKNFIVSVVSKYAHKIEKRIGSVQTILIIGVLPVIGYMGIAYTNSYFGVLFCFCFQITRGISQIVLKDALNKRVTADFRATANSVSQMGVRVIFLIFGPLLGYIIDSKGIAIACFTMGCLYILFFFLSTLRLVSARDEFVKIK